MKADRKTLVILLCLAGGAPAMAGCGGDDERAPTAPPRPDRAASPPIEIALKPAHHSGVTRDGHAGPRPART